jgi:hypothetical protein
MMMSVAEGKAALSSQPSQRANRVAQSHQDQPAAEEQESQFNQLFKEGGNKVPQ